MGLSTEELISEGAYNGNKENRFETRYSIVDPFTDFKLNFVKRQYLEQNENKL